MYQETNSSWSLDLIINNFSHEHMVWITKVYGLKSTDLEVFTYSQTFLQVTSFLCSPLFSHHKIVFHLVQVFQEP